MLLLKMKDGGFVENKAKISELSQEVLCNVETVYVIEKAFYVTTKYYLADSYPEIIGKDIMPSIE